MPAFVVIAQIETAAENASDMAAEIAVLSVATRAELGCQHYQVCRDVESVGVWLIYEIWQSEAHWRAHLETPHLLRFKTEVVSKLGVLTAKKLAFLP